MLLKIAIPFIFFLTLSSNAQNYSSFFLPKDLTDNANAYVRFDDYSIELVNQKKMVLRRKMAVTVLNKNADYFANLTLPYDNDNKIAKVYMEFYNIAGKRIKKVKKGDFDDYSATGSYTLYSDDRVIHYDYTPIAYPYTVYYEYQLNWKYTAFIPKWMPVRHFNVGVYKSSFSFTYPTGFKIQKLESNFDGFNIKKSHSPNAISYSLENIKPFKYEILGLGLSEIVPSVKLASNKFYLAGVKGQAETWQELGKWMYDKLLASRNNLSEETRSNIRDMVKGVTDPIERAKIIYEYVQNKTRYINVVIGIGGWQPMEADEVDRLGYGDCKALTFYTKSLMDVAEVPSIYTIVFAGDQKENIKKDIVSLQGNHVFLCLPQKKDTIWLECTSQKVPFGYKNSFTDDRDVLAITPDGGKIVHTSYYKDEENIQRTVATYSLLENAEIQGSASIKSYGTQYMHHLSSFDGLQPKDLDKKMKNYLSFINNLSFSKIEVKNNKEKKRYEENIKFAAENYAIINQDASLIFKPNILNRNSYIPNRERNRQMPFKIMRGYKDMDEYTIIIPKNYQLSIVPKAINIENRFGKYSVTIEKLSDHSLKYTRQLIINRGNYSKELYEKYRRFRKRIKKLDNLKLLLTK